MWWTTHVAGLEGWIYEVSLPIFPELSIWESDSMHAQYPQIKKMPRNPAFALFLRTVLPTFVVCLFWGAWTYTKDLCGLFVL